MPTIQIHTSVIIRDFYGKIINFELFEKSLNQNKNQ